MKKAKNALLLALCAVLLVGATIAGTLAFLTDTDEVKNTFTVGKIDITLDEAKVDEYGAEIADADRVTENEYKLIPGKTYVKDPEIHVSANSEDSYLFVKITSNIDAYINATDIEDQLDQNGWTKLEGNADVWYQSYTKTDLAKDVKVFDTFTVLNNANNVADWDKIAPATSKIEIVAYAIQSEETGDASEAWAKLSNQFGMQ